MMETSRISITTDSCTSFAALKSKGTLAFAILLNASFIIAYIVKYSFSTENVINSRDLVENNTGTIKSDDIPVFCRGIDTNKYSTTSTAFTRISSEFIQRSGIIIVDIHTYDRRNIPKSRGGDIIFVWAKQSSGDGRVPGNVIDHGNGSYTGMIKVFWKGRTHVYARLVSAAENTCLRYKALSKYGSIVYTLNRSHGLRAKFLNKNGTELTPCNTNKFIYGSVRVCNFTTLNAGMSWFCGHPVGNKLHCTDLNSFTSAPYTSSSVSQNDKIQEPGYGMFKNTMEVNVTFKSTRNTSASCRERLPVESWTEPSPIGYFLNTRWEPVNCHTSLEHTVKSYRPCFRNKTLFLLGDSTVRQYLDFFLKHILDLDINIALEPELTFGPNLETYHGRNTYINHGITIIYRKHAMPFHFARGNIPIKNIVSFPQIIDSVTASNISDSDIIVLLNYHTHFTAFRPSAYRERLRALVASLKRLFIRKPSAKVFFKSPSPCTTNSKWFDPQISLLYKKILEEEVIDIMDKVIYLNVWEIGVALNVANDVHPPGDAFKSQIQQFMFFIC